MIWSFSSHVTFKRCPRSWFYGKILATRSRSSPESKEAKRLYNLLNLQSWRGKIVDQTLSECVVPAVAAGGKVSESDALHFAKSLFEPTARRTLDHKNAERDGGSPIFFEEEYGQQISKDKFDDAWNDVESSITTFFHNDELQGDIRSAIKAVAQRRLIFSSWNVRAIAVPDLILFHRDRPPTIVDWKVQSKPKQDSWLQLGIYTLAITRVKKHVDWPDDPSRFSATDIRVIESQLLRGELKEHQVTTEDVNSIDDLIVASDDEMGLCIRTNNKMDLTAESFSAASNPTACTFCNFKKICWVV